MFPLQAPAEAAAETKLSEDAALTGQTGVGSPFYFCFDVMELGHGPS